MEDSEGDGVKGQDVGDGEMEAGEIAADFVGEVEGGAGLGAVEDDGGSIGRRVVLHIGGWSCRWLSSSDQMLQIHRWVSGLDKSVLCGEESEMGRRRRK